MTRGFSMMIAVAAALLFCAPVQAADKTTKVKFAAGASSASVSGSIKGYDTHSYVLGANGGQAMSVLFDPSNSACYFNLIAPGADSAMFMGDVSGNEFADNLPSSGDYRVEVFMMRSAARRNETCNFSMTFEISG